MFVEVINFFLYVFIRLFQRCNFDGLGYFCGDFFVCVEEVFEILRFEEVELVFCCINLENCEMFLKSDFIFRILRVQLDGLIILVYQMEEEENNFNFIW